MTCPTCENDTFKCKCDLGIKFIDEWSLPSITDNIMEKSTCKDCERYREMGYGPSYDGSRSCRMSKSIASGGTTAHCTCNACF